MPIYEYLCTSCGHRADILHGINDHGPAFCRRAAARNDAQAVLVAHDPFQGIGLGQEGPRCVVAHEGREQRVEQRVERLVRRLVRKLVGRILRRSSSGGSSGGSSDGGSSSSSGGSTSSSSGESKPASARAAAARRPQPARGLT